MYAPSTDHDDESIDIFCDGFSKAVGTNKTHNDVIHGDFNAKVDIREDNETTMRNFWIGRRNERESTLTNKQNATK